MTAEQLLAWLDQQGLVSEKEIADLRRQITGSKRQLSAKSVAILLQTRGYLTASQAKRLLEEAGRARAAGPAPAPGRSPREGEATSEAPTAEGPLVPDDQPLLLDDIGVDALDDVLGATAAGDEDTAEWGRGVPRRKPGLLRAFRRRRAAARPGGKGRRENPWDSPLLLVGGGVLILLVLAGVTLLYLINRGGGDKLLKLAQDAYHNGSYTQAIDKYDQFLERFPRHPSASLGKVRRGLAQLRQTAQSTRDGGQRLESAKQVLGEIEQEPAFIDARDELASLLPDIAEHLAEQAQASKDAAAATQNVDLANEAMALVLNTNYVPKSLRPGRRVQRIREALELVLRDLERDRALVSAMAAIRSAIDSGDTRKAYTVRAKLLKDYPLLSTDAALDDVVLEIARAEKANIKTVRKAISANTTDPLPPSLALAARRGPSPNDRPGKPVLVTAAGAVYALDGQSGQLRWRRPVGFDHNVRPVMLGGEDPDHALLVDVARNELVCVDLATGRLRWRFPVGERFATPSVMQNRILVAARSGKLLLIDPGSGASSEHVVMPQRLRTPPVPHPRGDVVYQLGEHSSLYVLSAADLRCREVFYLGHAAGSAGVAPVVVLDQVIVAENLGHSAATLHVLSNAAGGTQPAPPTRSRQDRSEAGAPGDGPAQRKVLQAVQQIRLVGHVMTPPAVDGRLLAVATDQGQVTLFDVAAGGEGEPLTQVAERSATGKEPRIHYPLLSDSMLWIAGAQLTGYRIQPQTGRLGPQGIDRSYQGDSFDGPLQRVGKLLVHVRRRPGHHGVTVAATDMADGKQIWETELGMRPAAEPQVNVQRGVMALVTSAAATFQFDAEAIANGVGAQPHYAPSPAGPVPLLTHRIDLGPGRAAYASDAGGREVLVCDLRPDNSAPLLKWIHMPVDLICAPCVFGSGLLAPTRRGQVCWIDPATGSAVAGPFQPVLAQANLPTWRTPSIVGDQRREFVVADGSGKLYRVGIKDQPTRHLVGLAETEHMPQSIIAAPVVQGETVLAATSANDLLPFALPDLEPGTPIELGGRPTWGPVRIGAGVLVATELDELLCVDRGRALLWRYKLRHGPLAGLPLAAGDQYVLASNKGTLWRLDAATGEELARFDTGQPLATGPVALDGQLIVATRDGAVLKVKMP